MMRPSQQRLPSPSSVHELLNLVNHEFMDSPSHEFMKKVDNP
jgi:hypothetical protein